MRRLPWAYAVTNVTGGRNGEERQAIARGEPIHVNGRALLGPTTFPVLIAVPETFQGERLTKTRAGKWLVEFDPALID